MSRSAAVKKTRAYAPLKPPPLPQPLRIVLEPPKLKPIAKPKLDWVTLTTYGFSLAFCVGFWGFFSHLVMIYFCWGWDLAERLHG